MEMAAYLGKVPRDKNPICLFQKDIKPIRLPFTKTTIRHMVKKLKPLIDSTDITNQFISFIKNSKNNKIMC
jgi:hypothetical protein